MSGLRRSLEDLFGREIAGLVRWSRRLSLLGRRAGGRRTGRSSRSGETRGLHETLSSARLRPPPHRRRRRQPRGVPFLASCVSLAVHAALLSIIVAFVVPPPRPRPSDGDEGVTIKWIVRTPPPREPSPPPAPEPPQPDPRAGAPSALEERQGEPPGASAAEVVEKEPARGSRAADTHPAESIGPGGAFAPPPLPSPGAAAGTSPAGVRGRSDLSHGFGARGAGKSAALGRYGGDASTEDAVDRGLRWLAAHRDPRGGWRAAGFTRQCRGFIPCRGAGGRDYDVGVTALAVLAFLGAGHLPELDHPETVTGGAEVPPAPTGPYGSLVESALAYLIGEQTSSGCYGITGSNYMYNHSIATLAVAEAYALTRDRRYAESATRAVRFTSSSQQSGGGWDYTAHSTGRNDLSISGWQVMALASAANAGIDVPASTFAKLRRYLDRAITPDGIGIYANRGTEAGRRGINMVAVGLLSRVLLDEGPDLRSMVRAAELLLLPDHAPDGKKMADWEKHFQSYYYWYTASLALFLHSAERNRERWGAWNHFVRRELLRLQSRRPHEDGSWPPEPNWVGISGGRVYATAINVLTLETYYRYDPLPRSPETARR